MAASWSLAPLVSQRAQEHPTRPLATTGDRTWTYQQVDADASSLAAALSELGLGRGDRIAVNLPNGIEWIIATLAAARLGAVLVPVSPQLSVHDLRYQLRHAEVSCVVTIEQWGAVDFLQRFEELLGDLPDLQYVVTVGDAMTVRVIATPAMVVTLTAGFILASWSGAWNQGWLHAKLLLVAGMAAVHGILARDIRRGQERQDRLDRRGRRRSAGGSPRLAAARGMRHRRFPAMAALTARDQHIGDEAGHHRQEARNQDGPDGLVDVHRIGGAENTSNDAPRQGLDGSAQRHQGWLRRTLDAGLALGPAAPATARHSSGRRIGCPCALALWAAGLQGPAPQRYCAPAEPVTDPPQQGRTAVARRIVAISGNERPLAPRSDRPHPRPHGLHAASRQAPGRDRGGAHGGAGLPARRRGQGRAGRGRGRRARDRRSRRAGRLSRRLDRSGAPLGLRPHPGMDSLGETQLGQLAAHVRLELPAQGGLVEGGSLLRAMLLRRTALHEQALDGIERSQPGVTQLERSEQLMTASYEKGAIAYDEVLVVRLELVAAKLDYADLLLTAATARVELAAAAGVFP